MRVTVKNFTDSLTRYVDSLHVSKPYSDIQVAVREAIDRSLIKHPDWVMTEASKQACVRYAMRRHESNRKLYANVMGGR